MAREWKAQRPSKPGLYFASFQGRAVARVRCNVNEWGELVGKVLLKRPEGVPDEYLKQVGFEEEIPASLDFLDGAARDARRASPHAAAGLGRAVSDVKEWFEALDSRAQTVLGELAATLMAKIDAERSAAFGAVKKWDKTVYHETDLRWSEIGFADSIREHGSTWLQRARLRDGDHGHEPGGRRYLPLRPLREGDDHAERADAVERPAGAPLRVRGALPRRGVGALVLPGKVLRTGLGEVPAARSDRIRGGSKSLRPPFRVFWGQLAGPDPLLQRGPWWMFSACMCTIKCQWATFWGLAPMGDTVEYTLQTGWCFGKTPTPQCEKDCEAERKATENSANNTITNTWLGNTYNFPQGKPYNTFTSFWVPHLSGGAIACTKTTTCT